MNPLSKQCKATAKRSGERCLQQVIGGGVCFKHGGNAPAVKRKRLERVALAEALRADPRRAPADVLADVGHQADWLMREARESVKAGAPTSDLLQVTELADVAGRWAKIALDADVDQRQTRVAEAHAVILAGVVRRILDRLELTDAQRALVADVVPEEFERAELEAGDQP